ncbi:MAG: MFS transporter [Janthinobacterium lividum]
MLDSNIVAVSLPAIARDMHAAFADIEWVVSAYVLTFAAALLPAGALADRLGRRRMLMVGLAVFTLASLLCGMASRPSVLNWSRALQGIGAALQLSAALALMGHTFKGPDRARAFAFWGIVVGSAVAAGPVVGGIVTSTVGWRWAFLVNVPIGIALIGLASTSLDESRDPGARHLDLPGIVLFGSGLFLLVWAAIDANAVGWGSNATLVKLAAGTTLVALFIVVERLRAHPMIDLTLFGRPTYLGSTFAMLGYAFAGQVMMTLLPLYLQVAHAQTPLVAGLAMLPFAVPLVLSPWLTGFLAERWSGRMILTVGLVVIALGNLVTAAAIACLHGYAPVAVAMVVTGVGTGMLNSETTKVHIGAVPPERAGMAGGLTGTTRFVGIVAGIAGLGAILATVTSRHLTTRLQHGASPLPDPADIHALALRVVAGDVPFASTLSGASDPLVSAARKSFSAGFENVLLAAAAVSAACALLAFVLVRADETAPHQREHGAGEHGSTME